MHWQFRRYQYMRARVLHVQFKAARFLRHLQNKRKARAEALLLANILGRRARRQFRVLQQAKRDRDAALQRATKAFDAAKQALDDAVFAQTEAGKAEEVASGQLRLLQRRGKKAQQLAPIEKKLVVAQAAKQESAL